MNIIIALSFAMLFVTIPVGLISIAAKVYGDGIKLRFVLGRLLTAFFVYLAFSLIIPLFILYLVFDSDSKSGDQNFRLVAQTFCLIAIAAYGFIGWLLCSLVNGKLIKKYAEFNLTDEKPQSLSLDNY